MNDEFNFVWIDDDIKRIETYWPGILKSGIADMSAQVSALQVTDDAINWFDKWANTNQASPPDLIIVDHNFTQVQNLSFGLKGSSLAHLLRLRFSEVPMVCVSGQNIQSDQFDFEDLSEYTYIFSLNGLTHPNELERLFAIARDFPLVKLEQGRATREHLVEIIGAPLADRSALMSILPEEFESKVVHGTSAHRVGRWILNVLMKRPGFLYDSLDAATALGVNEIAFTSKLAGLFSPAKYSGPFATTNHPLWWASSLIDVLYTLLPDSTSRTSQRLGRELPGLDAEDFSKCYLSAAVDPPPDAVAYTDQSASKREAVRLEFTEPLIERGDSLLGFSSRLKIRNTRRGS